jgi:hypothetical protein
MTALQSLAQMICHSANARLVRVEFATKKHPTRIHFCADVAGNPPVESLPVDDFNSRSVRACLRQYRVESVEAK